MSIGPRQLAAAIKRNAYSAKDHDWWGVITSVVSFPTPNVGVLVNGTTTPITCLIQNSYAQNGPQIGDTVCGRADDKGDHWVVDVMATSFPAWVTVTTF